MKDFEAYADAQEKIEKLYSDASVWNKMCLSNIAHSGRFSSDRTISEYAIGIWKVNQFVVETGTSGADYSI